GANTPIQFLGDFTEVELRCFYTLAAWRFELTASNLLDEEYYSNTFERLNLGYQVNPPRQLTGSVRYRF
ncbi:MAG: TonB-dependent receptor, partial [Steroidobacter sp.]